MPLLSRAKRRVGRALGGAAMHADARQMEFCTYLSAILLAGLLLNALLGLWWADPVAGFVKFRSPRGFKCRIRHSIPSDIATRSRHKGQQAVAPLDHSRPQAVLSNLFILTAYMKRSGAIRGHYANRPVCGIALLRETRRLSRYTGIP